MTLATQSTKTVWKDVNGIFHDTEVAAENASMRELLRMAAYEKYEVNLEVLVKLLVDNPDAMLWLMNRVGVKALEPGDYPDYPEHMLEDVLPREVLDWPADRRELLGQVQSQLQHGPGITQMGNDGYHRAAIALVDKFGNRLALEPLEVNMAAAIRQALPDGFTATASVGNTQLSGDIAFALQQCGYKLVKVYPVPGKPGNAPAE